MTDGSAIKFGTDGWRGHIAGDFTYDNVARVLTAIVDYLAETGFNDKPLLIGYDRRFAAENYAAHAAAVATGRGQRVLLMDGNCPTPVVAYAVMHFGAAGAVMFTASHNPYYYQGLKFIPWFAGPAMPETTDRLTVLIRQLGSEYVPPGLTLNWAGERVNVTEDYFTALDRLVDPAKLGSHGLKVLYTAMHGAGAGFMDAYLARCGVEVASLATDRDVYFGGTLPDPSPANLLPLAARAAEQGCHIVVGTDGDADRFGLVDPAGNYFGANQALPLLTEYLVRGKGMSGPVVRTVATSHLVDAVARLHGLPVVETAVGFKYVGDELRRGALIGGEESGGISIQGHIPEKDGILATLLILEMMASSGLSLAELLADQMQRAGNFAYRRIDLTLDDSAKNLLLDRLNAYDKPLFAGRTISGSSRIDGVQLSFEDGSWMLVRASGTEPLVRIYVETSDSTTLDSTCRDIRGALTELAGVTELVDAAH